MLLNVASKLLPSAWRLTWFFFEQMILSSPAFVFWKVIKVIHVPILHPNLDFSAHRPWEHSMWSMYPFGEVRATLRDNVSGIMWINLQIQCEKNVFPWYFLQLTLPPKTRFKNKWPLCCHSEHASIKSRGCVALFSEHRLILTNNYVSSRCFCSFQYIWKSWTTV